ncbi:MAG: LytTR family DNA-binding domain-containing protein [Bacteroidota bacterium]
MKVRCLIVDDEPLAIRLIEKHIAKLTSLEVVATCNSALKAFEVLQREPIDLLFLDIKMPSINGLDFLKTLKRPPKTILTTAYRDYALESYDLDVVDYLLKPITFDRFFKAIERYFRENPLQKPAATAPQPLVQPNQAPSFIIIKSGNKHHKVAISLIVYVESLKDYIKVHTGEKYIVSKYKISDFEKQLPSSFIRVHRSYIINLAKVTAFTSHDIELGAIEIPIGISYRGKVMEVLSEGK